MRTFYTNSTTYMCLNHVKEKAFDHDIVDHNVVSRGLLTNFSPPLCMRETHTASKVAPRRLFRIFGVTFAISCNAYVSTWHPYE